MKSIMLMGVVSLVVVSFYCHGVNAVSGVMGDSHEEFGTDDYKRDKCNACGYLFDYLDKQMEKPIKSARGLSNDPKRQKKMAEEYASSEVRALELIEEGLCKDTFGATKKKCDRYVEENEDELVNYIRKSGNKDPEMRKKMCAKDCKDVPEKKAPTPPERPNRRPPPPPPPKKVDVVEDKKLGIVEELNEKASRFIVAPEEERQELKTRVRELATQQEGGAADVASHAELYLSAIVKIEEKGNEYVDQELARLQRVLSTGEVAEDKKVEMVKKRNILSTFQTKIESAGQGGNTEGGAAEAAEMKTSEEL